MEGSQLEVTVPAATEIISVVLILATLGAIAALIAECAIKVGKVDDVQKSRTLCRKR